MSDEPTTGDDYMAGIVSTAVEMATKEMREGDQGRFLQDTPFFGAVTKGLVRNFGLETADRIVETVRNDPKYREIAARHLKSAEEHYAEQLAEELKKDQLLDLAGLALRDVIPYAENEVSGLAEIVSDDPATNGPLYDTAYQALSRAQQTYILLVEGGHTTVGAPGDLYDDTFEIRFDEPVNGLEPPEHEPPQ